MKLCEERFDHREVDEVDGLPVASAVRAACFEARYARDLEAAVVALDLAAFHDLVSVEEAAVWMLGHPSYTGIEQGRQAVALADENVWSPMEPVMRLEWQDAGFRRPLANRPIFDRRPDATSRPPTSWTRTPGSSGSTTAACTSRGSGGTPTSSATRPTGHWGSSRSTMVAGDLSRRWQFRQRLTAAYARAGSRPVAGRRWTLELPDWWTPTYTVGQRRALSQAERQRWLKNRLAG